MKIVDVNVLLYLVNESCPQHASVKQWWLTQLSDVQPIGLTWVVILGFLRISTMAKVFERPLSIEEASEKIDHWLSHRNTRLVSESKEHWAELKSAIASIGVAGNLTTDAHLATLAVTRGATLVSCDNDFARFQHLKWENPLHEKR